MKLPLNRRSFLQAAGVAIAIPAMEALAPTRALAAIAAAPPKRLITICTTLGLHAPSLFPETAGTDYEMTPYLKHLAEHRDKFTLFAGLSHPNQAGKDGHSSQMTWLTAAENPGLSGFQNSISIDQLAAEKLGYVTRFPSITLSSDGGSSQSYNRSGVMVPAEHRPSKVFADMFLQGKEYEIKKQKQLLGEGRSILDLVGGQANRLKRNVSANDRERLEEYFNSIREAERNLGEADAWVDRPKPKVDAELPPDIAKDNDLIGRTNLLMKLLPLIVQSDSSRVITVTLHGRNDVPVVDGVKDDHHNLSHHGQDETKIAQLMRIETELMKSFAGLLGGLSEKKEAGSSLLDNTMIVFGSNLGNANAHDWRNLPIIAAGGKFKHGRFVKHDAEKNVPLSNLYLTMLQNLGIESDKFGTSSSTLTW
ncbi:DUF1552 domain-containing protein [Mariniblastus fucicola]|uniref:DUF1552 domain-containing protein n=1 Tax=Mariniblastus fucicola TaxID=980251 RepID=A0A5B9PAE3_9BACT|nr:DUF1552 domain-containing protein [Mariniblastus fucicola]QEG23234.1 hypothetical protein MFFC18_31300 [Mariniblastus fucicola]